MIIRTVRGIDLKKYKMKIILVSILFILSNINFSFAQDYILNCMQEDVYINEDKKRLSAAIPNTSVPPRFYSFELKKNEINYFMPFFRTDDGFSTIWKMSIDLVNMKRSFTVRKIPDRQMKVLFNLYKEANIKTDGFLAQEKLEKDEYSNKIFSLKKKIFDKNYVNPQNWNGTLIPFGNNGDYILKKGEIDHQTRFTFPCKIKN